MVDAVERDGKYKDISLTPDQRPVLAATKKKFLGNLLHNIEDRFPEDAMDILQAFTIFDPNQVPPREAPGSGEYGEDEISILADYFTAKGKYSTNSEVKLKPKTKLPTSKPKYSTIHDSVIQFKRFFFLNHSIFINR